MEGTVLPYNLKTTLNTLPLGFHLDGRLLHRVPPDVCALAGRVLGQLPLVLLYPFPGKPLVHVGDSDQSLANGD